MWRRREVLGLMGAGAALPALPAVSAMPMTLTARAGMARLAPADMPETAIWGFDGDRSLTLLSSSSARYYVISL